MKNITLATLLPLCVALCLLLPSAASAAGRLEKINVLPSSDGIQVKLSGTEKLKYKVQDYKSPPRILIQLYETVNGVPYEKIPVDQGPITNLKLMQVEKKGAPATFLNIHLTRTAKYDFDQSADGKELTVKIFTSGAGGAESLPPALVNPNEYDQNWSAPEIWAPGAKKQTGGSTQQQKNLPEYARQDDTTPFVEGPIKIVDADASQVSQILSKAFGASIVLDKQILLDEETMKAAGTPTGITLSLSNVTLQDALDAIAAANAWKWNKIGDTYILLHPTTDEYGYEMMDTARYSDPAQQMDVMVFTPRYIDACRFSTYASTIIPLPTKYFYCDPSANVAVLRGSPKDLERATKLFKEMDTLEMRNRPNAAENSRQYDETQNFVTKVLRLKYIRAEDLYNKLKPLIGVDGNPYLGNLQIVTSFGKGLMGQTGTPLENWAENTLAFDSTTNTLVFVGRSKIFSRLKEIIDLMDVPYSASVVRMIPLKYVQVADLKSDLTAEGGEGGSSNFFSNIDKMFGRGSDIFLSEDTNSITFVGTEDDYDRLIQLINTVDVESREFTSEAVPLENVRVEDLYSSYDKTLKPILETKEYGLGKAKLTFNPVSNSVIVAAQRQYMDRITKLLRTMDVEPQDITTKEIKLKYMKADRMLQIVKNMVAKNANMDTFATTDDGSFFSLTADRNLPEKYQTYQSSQLSEGAFGDINKLALHAENTRNSLVVSGTKNDVKKIEKLVEMLDKPFPQIKIDVQLIEMRHAGGKDIGMGYVYQDKRFTGNFNFSSYPHPEESVSDHATPVITEYSTGQDGNPVPQWGLGDPFHQITGSAGFFLFDTAENFITQFAPTLKALVTEETGRFIAEPSVVLQEDMKADFSFVDEVPFIQGSIDPTTNLIMWNVEKQNIGFIMTLKAHYTEDGYIVLNMDPILYITLKGVKVIQTPVLQEIPIIARREVSTEVKLQNGQPFIISGFTHNVDNKTVEKIPVLADLPLFGKLFRTTSTESEEVEVIIVVTPTIIPVCHEKDQQMCP